MNELFAPPESGLLISYLRVSLEDENTGESESISNQRDLIWMHRHFLNSIVSI